MLARKTCYFKTSSRYKRYQKTEKVVFHLLSAPGTRIISETAKNRLNVPQRRACIEIFFIKCQREKHLKFENMDIIAMFILK